MDLHLSKEEGAAHFLFVVSIFSRNSLLKVMALPACIHQDLVLVCPISVADIVGSVTAKKMDAS